LRFEGSHPHRQRTAEIGRRLKKDYTHQAPCGSRDPGEPLERFHINWRKKPL
jgi:hypothetical protein